jgi:hypothetical protein
MRAVDGFMKGLILVHGIGEQKRKDVFQAFFAGIRVICAEATQEQVASNAWRVTIEDTCFMVYEAYWADLLSGDDVKGTFDFDKLGEFAWYPSINYRLRDDFRRVYTKSHVRLWTWLLVGLWPFVYLGHDWGWDLLVALTTMSDRWEKLLDEIPGDVVNFVKSAGGAYERASGAASEMAYRGGDWVDVAFNRLAPKAIEITERFLDVLDHATQRDGCTEIHVLAHSLGTVVVHRALAGNTTDFPPAGKPPAQMTRLYTIGCPLEKIRFFWPKLFEKRVDSTVLRNERIILRLGSCTRWDNFWSRSDVVSGKLSSFPGLPKPVNHSAKGLGGFFTAHVSYLRNPQFLSLVLKEATSRPEAFQVPRARISARLCTTIQNLMAPVAFVAFACLGIAGAGAIGWVVAWIWATLLDWLGGALEWGFLVGHFWWLKWFFWLGFANLVFLSFTFSHRNRAMRSQGEYWGPPSYRALKHDGTTPRLRTGGGI